MKEHLFRTFNLVSALSILWMEMSARVTNICIIIIINIQIGAGPPHGRITDVGLYWNA